MAHSWLANKTLIAANAAIIAASQSPGAGAIALTNAAGVTLDTQRQVIVTSGGNDSGIFFTVTGKNDAGQTIVETIPGANVGAAATTQSFLTVTSVTHTGSIAGTVTVGTNTVGSTPWTVLDYAPSPINIGIGVTVSATVNYTVEYTYDDPNEPFSGPANSVDPNGRPLRLVTVWALTALAAKSANTDASILSPIRAIRLTVNSGNGEARAVGVISGMPRS